MPALLYTHGSHRHTHTQRQTCFYSSVLNMTTPDCISQSPLLNKQWCVRCWPPTHSHSIFDEAVKISACMPYASSLQCYHSNSTYLPTPSPVSCTINRDDRLTAVCVHYGAASKRFHTHAHTHSLAVNCFQHLEKFGFTEQLDKYLWDFF